jgi:hypothetical protein
MKLPNRHWRNFDLLCAALLAAPLTGGNARRGVTLLHQFGK